MRVLFVSQEFPPETGWGGIGTYVDVLSEALVAKGVEVHVLSVVEDQRESTRRVGEVTVHRHPLPRVERPGRFPPQMWRRLWVPFTVARLVRRLDLQPDVIEAPEWMAEGFVLGLRGKYPLVVRLHSSARQLFPYTGQGTWARGYDGRISARLEETSARWANVVVSTRSNLDEVSSWMKLEERALHAIPYPVRLPPLWPMPDPQEPRVTFVGRLEPRKAPEVVLRAAPGVLQAVPTARFVFVGRDVGTPGAMPTSPWIRDEAERLGVTHAIELTGQLDRVGVTEQLRRATVCAFPSRWESFGNVLAEAGATGRPVVASPIPPFRELVEDGVTGCLLPPDDLAAWSASLIGLLCDQERAAVMGRSGAERIARISAPELVADLALASYEHAIERWRRGERAGRGLRATVRWLRLL